MTRPRLRQIDSVEGLRRLAAPWDRLWERSEVTLPTARAELVAQWVEQFGAGRALRVLVVEAGGELVGALPLAGRRTHRVLPVGDVTWNYWSPNGELLVDPEADVPAVLDLLVAGLEETRWPLLWLDLAPLETSRWQSLLGALVRRGLAADVHLRYRIGQAEMDGDFETYFAQRSRATGRACARACGAWSGRARSCWRPIASSRRTTSTGFSAGPWPSRIEAGSTRPGEPC